MDGGDWEIYGSKEGMADEKIAIVMVWLVHMLELNR
jgi:hypothetical protein